MPYKADEKYRQYNPSSCFEAKTISTATRYPTGSDGARFTTAADFSHSSDSREGNKFLAIDFDSFTSQDIKYTKYTSIGSTSRRYRLWDT